MSKKALVAVLTLLCILLLASCNHSVTPKYGNLSVSVDMDSSRTIEPVPESITCSSYTIQGSHANGTSFPEETMDTNPYTKTGLAVGNWTITINGYNADGVLIATNTEVVTIEKDKTTDATFNLSYLSDGTGSCSISFVISGSDTNVASIFFDFEPVLGGAPIYSDIENYSLDGDGNKVYTFSSDSFSTGLYLLTATIKNSNGVALLIYGPEVVRIYKNLQSVDSITISAQFIPMVTKPQISPNGGNFTGSASVTITCATEGSSIYYTLNGDDPDSTSTLYTGPIVINSNTEVIKAVAYKTGLASSEVAQTTVPFLISVISPQISPNGGSYSNAQSISITSGTPGASIYYTLDGSTPTSNSTKYTGSFTLGIDDSVVKAIALKESMVDSSVTSSDSFSFTVATPTITPDGCEGTTSQEVTITLATVGASIRYTTDGSTPTTDHGTLYDEPFTITENVAVIKAIAYLANMKNSSVASSTHSYAIDVEAPEFSVVDVASGKKKIVISGGTSGATIEYSFDSGSTWNTYIPGTTVLEFSENTSIKFRISKTGLTSVERIVSVIWDEGSGGLSYNDPIHGSVSLVTPGGWTGVIQEGIPVTLSATVSLSNASTDGTVFVWYLDGSLIQGQQAETLILFSDVILSVGSHTISVIASQNGEIWSSSIPVLVEEKTTYLVGDVGPAGGLIFYDCDADDTELDPDGSDNLTSSVCGWRYLELAPSDCESCVFGYKLINTLSEGYKAVYVNGTQVYSASNCTLATMGSGESNSGLILTSMPSSASTNGSNPSPTSVYAAKVCSQYSVNGYSDWFLPSAAELEMCYATLHENVAFDLSGYYWSSSENGNYFGAYFVYPVNMSNGQRYTTTNSVSERGQSHKVRAIRSFK